MTNKTRFILSLTTIFLLWVAIPIVMDVYDKWLEDKTALRYSIYFGWLFIVGGIGYSYWKKRNIAWAMRLWLYTYAMVLVLLLAAGAVDLLLYPFNHDMKQAVQNFRLFFMSPAPLVLLFFFDRLSQKK